MAVEKERIMEAIYKAIDEVNSMLPTGGRVEKSPEAVLLGSGGKLDSLGFVNFITAVEQGIEREFNTSITLADEKAMSQTKSPFNTVEGLSDYIYRLLESNDG